MSTCLWDAEREGDEGATRPYRQLDAPCPTWILFLLLMDPHHPKEPSGTDRITATLIHTQDPVSVPPLSVPRLLLQALAFWFSSPRPKGTCLPDAVHVGKINLPPETAKEEVTNPAGQCESP